MKYNKQNKYISITYLLALYPHCYSYHTSSNQYPVKKMYQHSNISLAKTRL